MQHANWDRVDVVTNAQDEDSLNPVIPALQAMISAGELPATVNIHTVRVLYAVRRHTKAVGREEHSSTTNPVSLKRTRWTKTPVLDTFLPAIYAITICLFNTWHTVPQQSTVETAARGARGWGCVIDSPPRGAQTTKIQQRLYRDSLPFRSLRIAPWRRICCR